PLAAPRARHDGPIPPVIVGGRGSLHPYSRPARVRQQGYFNDEADRHRTRAGESDEHGEYAKRMDSDTRGESDAWCVRALAPDRRHRLLGRARVRDVRIDVEWPLERRRDQS